MKVIITIKKRVDKIQLGIFIVQSITLVALFIAAFFTMKAAEYYDRETSFNVNLKLNEFDRRIMDGYIGRPHVEALFMQPPNNIGFKELANMRLRLIVNAAKIDQRWQGKEMDISNYSLAKLLNIFAGNPARSNQEQRDSASNFPELVSVKDLEKYLYGPDNHYDKQRIILAEALQLAEGVLYLLYNAYEAMEAKLMTNEDFDSWTAYLGDIGDHPLFLVAIRNWHDNGYFTASFARKLKDTLLDYERAYATIDRYYGEMLDPNWADSIGCRNKRKSSRVEPCTP